MKAVLWKLIHQWRDATTTEAAWIARDQIDIELDKIEAAATQEVAAKYIGTCSDGNLLQPYVDIKKGTSLFTAAGAAPAGTILTTIIAEIEAIDCYYYGDPSHEHCPFSIREKASDIVKKHAKQLEAAPAKEQASFPTRDAELWLTKNKLAMHEKLGAAPVQQVFGGRVDPSYVSGPIADAMTKEEWTSKAVAELKSYGTDYSDADSREYAESLYATYVEDNGYEWADDPKGAVSEDLSYWSW